MKKKIWPIFPRIIECDKPQGTIYKRPEGNLTNTVYFIECLFKDLRGCWKHNFLKKKAKVPVKKIFWPIFSRTIEHDKRQKTTYKGLKSSLTHTVHVIRSYL